MKIATAHGFRLPGIGGRAHPTPPRRALGPSAGRSESARAGPFTYITAETSPVAACCTIRVKTFACPRFAASLATAVKKSTARRSRYPSENSC